MTSSYQIIPKQSRWLTGCKCFKCFRFQRHVICYLLVITVLSVSIILPLNFQGELQGDVTSFEHTTLVNLEASSDYLWVHICLAFFFFPLAILVIVLETCRAQFHQCTALTCADPKSIKKTVKLSIFFKLLGSTSVKAAHKMLVKLTPEI